MGSAIRKLAILKSLMLVASPVVALDLHIIPMTRAEAWCISQRVESFQDTDQDPFRIDRPLFCDGVRMPMPKGDDFDTRLIENRRNNIRTDQSPFPGEIRNLSKTVPIFNVEEEGKILISPDFYLNKSFLNCFSAEKFEERDEYIVGFDFRDCSFVSLETIGNRN